MIYTIFLVAHLVGAAITAAFILAVGLRHDQPLSSIFVCMVLCFIMWEIIVLSAFFYTRLEREDTAP